MTRTRRRRAVVVTTGCNFWIYSCGAWRRVARKLEEPANTFYYREVNSALGCGYIIARNDTTQQPGQTPDKEVQIWNVTDYVSGYTETDTTGMLSPPTVWRQQSLFRPDSLVRHLLQFAWDTGVAVSMDTHVGLNVATRVCDVCPDKCWSTVFCWLCLQCSPTLGVEIVIPYVSTLSAYYGAMIHGHFALVSLILQKVLLQSGLWFIPWHQIMVCKVWQNNPR